MILIKGSSNGEALAAIIKEMEDEAMRKRMEAVAEPEATEEQQRALKAAVAYTRYLKAKHPTWSVEKVTRKVASHFHIKFV